eukprot:scaffold33965_cov51-Attheya_sp.AAC.2
MRLTLRSAALAATVFGSLAAAGAQDSTVTFQGATQNADGVISFPLIPHHVHRERTRRELGKEIPERRRLPGRQLDGSPAIQVGALYQGYGTHYVDLWVGTPPQRQTVIVDTGSGSTAFPCSGCRDCGGQTDAMFHTDLYFMEDNSDSFQKMECDACFKGHCGSLNGMQKVCSFGMSYQEGSSWSAYEGRDLSYIGGPHDMALSRIASGTEPGDNPLHASAFSFELKFGCQVQLKGLFRTQLADGIMGMENVNESFWKQMFDRKMIKEKKFSLCFSRHDSVERDGTESGAMTMGGTDTRLHSSPMLYAKNTKDTGMYTIHVRKMYLRENGGLSATPDKGKNQVTHLLDVDEKKINGNGIILDSGTTDTYLSRAIAGPFTKKWKEIVGTAYNNNGVNLTPEQMAALPTILFQVQPDTGSNDEYDKDPDSVTGLAGSLDPENPTDIIMTMPASHYMEWDSKRNYYVSRLYLTEGYRGVMGANSLMGHDFLFDIDAQRVGIAESNCDYTDLYGGYLQPEPEVTPVQEIPQEEPEVPPAEEEPEVPPAEEEPEVTSAEEEPEVPPAEEKPNKKVDEVKEESTVEEKTEVKKKSKHEHKRHNDDDDDDDDDLHIEEVKEKYAEEEEKEIINEEMSAEEKLEASSSEEDEMEAFICSDLKCRGYVALGFVGACLVLVIVKKSFSRKNNVGIATRPSSEEYQEVGLGDDLDAEYGEDGSDDGIPSNMNII